MNKLEICTGSIESVIAAKSGGADRAELCSALSEGGVTPSYGLIKEAVATGIKVNVLIRPRGGDFLYTQEEVDLMVADIEISRQLGANAVVIGALTKEGNVDMEACQRMMQAAQGMEVTFHRAFDMVNNADKALEDVIALGCTRILTSGLMPTAEEGIPTLRHLVERSAGRIIIMPGSGVSPQNADRILRETGATEIHASARTSRNSLMEYRNPTVTMGAKDADEYARKETDINIVIELKSIIN